METKQNGYYHCTDMQCKWNRNFFMAPTVDAHKTSYMDMEIRHLDPNLHVVQNNVGQLKYSSKVVFKIPYLSDVMATSYCV